MLWLIGGIILIGMIIHISNKDKEYMDETEIQSVQEIRQEKEQVRREKEQERIRQECMEKNEKIIKNSIDTVINALVNREQREQEFKKLVKELEELDEMAKELGIKE